MKNLRLWLLSVMAVPFAPAVTGPLAVVTGANKGVGFHVAQQLQDAGLRVIIACRNEALAKQAAATLGCEYEHLDLASDASIEAFAKNMETKYAQLDVLVNNAAIAFKAADPTPFKEQTVPTYPTAEWNGEGGVTVDFVLGKILEAS